MIFILECNLGDGEKFYKFFKIFIGNRLRRNDIFKILLFCIF